jgi:hypothetical protein
VNSRSRSKVSGLDDQRIRRILAPPGRPSNEWRDALARFDAGDVTLTRRSAGEAAIKAIQRMLVFLGYSTSSTGAFVIDGDFGRGTNRGLAQFQFEHGLSRRATRRTLCYPCTWQTAPRYIVGVPDVRLTHATLNALAARAIEAIETNHVMCGDFEVALSYLDAVHAGRLLNCREIYLRYRGHVDRAIAQIRAERSVKIAPEWIYAIIKQETGGIVRPRFEQHVLSRLHRKHPRLDFVELRFRAMSQGLGQVLGQNFRRVGAASAIDMYTSPLDEQALFIARFLAKKPKQIAKRRPNEADFRAIARFYNGRGYEKHYYHERLERWHREFSEIIH